MAEQKKEIDFINYNTPEYLEDKAFIPNPHHYITVKGAREHNLKGVSLYVPKNTLTVFSGLSGSGKSSLVFDTIYAEGQRRYVESLSSYARQFLGLKEKPDVDTIEGLSPAISIDQKSTSQNPRSTVGTITEIYDYLRLLYAKVGVQHDPKTGEVLGAESVTQMSEKILREANGKQAVFLAPIVNDKKGWHKQHFIDAKKNGFKRVRLNGKMVLIEEAEKMDLNKNQKHSIEVVIDRVMVNEENRLRVLDSLEAALKFGENKAMILTTTDDTEIMLDFNREKMRDLEPRQFSFNSPHGACPHCTGLGVVTQIDPDLVVPNGVLSIEEGCIRPFNKIAMTSGWFAKILETLAKKHKFSLKTPWKSLTEAQKNAILFGDDNFEGVISNLDRRYRETTSESSRSNIESFMTKKTCPTCQGNRLRQESLAVTVGGTTISTVANMSISDCVKFFEGLQDPNTPLLNDKEKEVSKLIVKEIINRLNFLMDVGLGYLSLMRSATTLSGGEAQRIRLATQIGSGLTGVLYILDEPSIGLHQRDNTRLLSTLKKLRDLGNTVLVVEHDEETIRESDFLVDIGPGAGIHGGHVIAAGTPAEVMKNPNSPTGRFLAGLENIAIPAKRREVVSGNSDGGDEATGKAAKGMQYITIVGAKGK